MAGLWILGGVGLTLFGVRFLRKGLDRLFGGRLVYWLEHMTANRVRAFVAGIGVGAIAPSSTALSISAVQMLGNSRINNERMLAVLLGSNVGLTITVQLLAFHIQDYFGLFIIAGIVGFLFLSRECFRGIGQCLLSLGFIFLSMNLIGSGAGELTESAEIRSLFAMLQGHPWIVAVAVAGLGVLLQSSTATIGLGLGLSGSGLLTSEILIPWIIGANIGLGITSLFVGWNEIEGRRMGLANLIMKVLLGVTLLLLPVTAQGCFGAVPGSLMRQTAMFHTGFNLCVGLLALPLLKQIRQICRFLLPEANERTLAARESYLDPNALETPSLALSHATREILRMSDRVRGMLETFWRAFTEGDIELARRIQKEDDGVDRINLELTDYLSRIGEDMGSKEKQWQFTLLTFSNELESVGDLVDKHLCDLLVKQRTEGSVLPAEDSQLIAEAYRRTLQRIELAEGLLTTRSMEEAKTFLAGKEAFNDWCRQAQRLHYERLASYSRSTLASSALLLDMLNAFRRINSHVSTLAYAIYRPVCLADWSKA